MCRLVRRATASEWIHYHIAGASRDVEAAACDHRLELVDVPSRLEFLVARRRGVLPEVREIQTGRVQVLAVTAVVLDLLAAMPALWDGNPDSVEGRRHSLGEVEQRVVRGVELPPARKRALHRHGNPMSKGHSGGLKV